MTDQEINEEEIKEELQENLKEIKQINALQRKKYRKLIYLIIVGNAFLLIIFTVLLWAFGFFG